jgi:chorismate mutase
MAAPGPVCLAPANAGSGTNRMMTRGVRGATTVDSNSPEAILDATKELLAAMVKVNEIDIDAVGSAFFTLTQDLNAEFPALAARQMGWTDVPLLCGHEMNKPGALPMCLRVLLHVNTDKPAKEIKHVYLRGARVLRPDIESQIR